HADAAVDAAGVEARVHGAGKSGADGEGRPARGSGNGRAVHGSFAGGSRCHSRVRVSARAGGGVNPQIIFWKPELRSEVIASGLVVAVAAQPPVDRKRPQISNEARPKAA